MPPGPIRGLRFVHSALRIQAQQIAEDSRRLNTPAEAVGLVGAVGLLGRALRGHAKGEDAGYFPALEARAPRSTASFTFDHEHEDRHLARLEQLVAGCDGPEEVEEIARLSAVISDQLDTHMTKEEQLLWPLTEELFSVQEQRDIIRAVLGVIPRDDLPELIAWITETVAPDDAVAYVEMLQRAQPPQVFATTTIWIHERVSPVRWQQLTAAIAGLG